VWAEVGERVSRLADALHQHGVGKADRVAVLMQNSGRYLELYLAVGWAGAPVFHHPAVNAVVTTLGRSDSFWIDHLDPPTIWIVILDRLIAVQICCGDIGFLPFPGEQCAGKGRDPHAAGLGS
jgi:hypothetical protein